MHEDMYSYYSSDNTHTSTSQLSVKDHLDIARRAVLSGASRNSGDPLDMERVKQGLALYEQILLSKNRKITEDGGSGGGGGSGSGGGGGSGSGGGGIEGRGGRASKGIASSGPVAVISLTGPVGRGSTATDRQTTLHSPLRSPTYSAMPSPTHSPTHSPTYNAPHNTTSRSKEPLSDEVRPVVLTSAACGVGSGSAADTNGSGDLRFKSAEVAGVDTGVDRGLKEHETELQLKLAKGKEVFERMKAKRLAKTEKEASDQLQLEMVQKATKGKEIFERIKAKRKAKAEKEAREKSEAEYQMKLTKGKQIFERMKAEQEEKKRRNELTTGLTTGSKSDGASEDCIGVEEVEGVESLGCEMAVCDIKEMKDDREASEH